jgi:hypothetical protein
MMKKKRLKLFRNGLSRSGGGNSSELSLIVEAPFSGFM